eukprot:Skav220520  [mRNA]  locus=scaffold5947:15735:17501:+ [translate_table: standard]
MLSTKRAIASAQQFLSGVRTLSTYAVLESRQKDGVLRAISRVVSFSPKEAAEILSLFDKDLWTSSSLEAFQSLVAERTSAVIAASRAPRRPNQDFRSLPKFLTEELMALVTDPNVDRQVVLAKMCRHAAKLGLCCPTERSLAVLLALSYFRSMEFSNEQEQFDLLDKKRDKIRKLLKQYAVEGTFLETLPESYEDLPLKLRQAVFSTGEPVADTELVRSINHLGKKWCLRGTNSGLQEFPSTSEEDLGCVVKKAVQEALQDRAGNVGASSGLAGRTLPHVYPQQRDGSRVCDSTGSRLPLAIQDGNREVAPQLAASTGCVEIGSLAPPAIEDGKLETAEQLVRQEEDLQEKRMPVADIQKMSVEQQLAALRNTGTRPTGTSLKRPAAAAPKGAVAKHSEKDPAGTSRKRQVAAAPEGAVFGSGGTGPTGTSWKKPAAAARRGGVLGSTGTCPTGTSRQGSLAAAPAGAALGSSGTCPTGTSRKRAAAPEGAALGSGGTCPTGTSSLGKPSSSTPAAKAVTGSKKKAKPKGVGKSKAKKPGSNKEELRRKLLATIPSTLLKKFRGGCAKCRRRAFCTVSCWQGRGYSLP